MRWLQGIMVNHWCMIDRNSSFACAISIGPKYNTSPKGDQVVHHKIYG